MFFQFKIQEEDIHIYFLKSFADESRNILLKQDNKIDLFSCEFIYLFV